MLSGTSIATFVVITDKKNELRFRSHIPKEALYKYVSDSINRKQDRFVDSLPRYSTYAVITEKPIFQVVFRQSKAIKMVRAQGTLHN